MFGLIVAGRAIQANMQQVAENKFLFMIPDGNTVNHIVVFLLGTTPIPSGFGAAVYFGFPPYKDFQFLGYLSNEKPSAVFKISNPQLKSRADGIPEIEMESPTIQVGLSFEPMTVIDQLVAQKEVTPTGTATVDDQLKVSKKILDNLFNYATSFAKPVTQPPAYFGGPPTTVDAIPADVFSKWYTNFETKIKKDPNWWCN